MGELTWEWTLGTSEKILARVDPTTLVESVYLGQRLVSRSGAGGKPDGHTVPLGTAGAEAYREAAPQELRLTFDPARCSFELRANGQVVPPVRAPTSPPPEIRPGHIYGHVPLPSYAPSRPPMPPRSGSPGAKIALVLLVGLVAGAIVSLSGVRKYIANARAAEAPAGSIAASTGLLVAHYPAGFNVTEDKKSSKAPAGREDVCPEGMCVIQSSLVKIKHASRDEGVIIASFKMNGLKIGVDPWRVSNFLHERFEELAKARGADYVETDRQDITCLGEPGAAVTGRLRNKGEDGTMWSCTFIHEGNAFMVTTSLNVKDAADAVELKKIIDATELLGSR